MSPRPEAAARAAILAAAGTSILLAVVAPVPPVSRPDPLPAELDPAFVADLGVLVAGVPDGARVGMAWRPGASTWQWTMGAYLEPRLRFDLVRPDEAFDGGVMLVESDLALPAPWRRSSCATRWCAWTR